MKLIFLTILQIIGAYGLGIIIPYALGIGNGWELLAIPLGTSIGVWLPAYFIQKSSWKLFLGSIIGGFIGMFLINNVIPAMGFLGLLFPVAGTFVGFYTLKLTRSH